MTVNDHTANHIEIVTALLRQQTPVRFEAGGPSMNPTIRGGEVVLVRPYQSSDRRAGAICLYRKNNRLVLHRLIRTVPHSDACRFSGDAALRGDEIVEIQNIIGVAVSVKRNGRDIALDSTGSRNAGRLRYLLRPLRRWLFGHQHPDHV